MIVELDDLPKLSLELEIVVLFKHNTCPRSWAYHICRAGCKKQAKRVLRYPASGMLSNEPPKNVFSEL
jgi:hypothetical protein